MSSSMKDVWLFAVNQTRDCVVYVTVASEECFLKRGCCDDGVPQDVYDALEDGYVEAMENTFEPCYACGTPLELDEVIDDVCSRGFVYSEALQEFVDQFAEDMFQ